MEQHNAITEEEAEQYDRQIRLWGVEAQKKYVNNIKCVSRNSTRFAHNIHSPHTRVYYLWNVNWIP